jgi:hypothetical protein
MTSLINIARRIQLEEQPRSIESLANDFASGDIYVPESQRLWSWNKKRGVLKMQCLVDSVMHGYPIPSIILNKRRDRRFEVYDGRHRIETFHRYRNNEFKWNGALYSELCDNDKEKFDRRQLPITITIEASQEKLAEVFLRLNAGVSLTDSDKLWAHRATPLVDATRRLVLTSERLSAALGGVDLENRQNLANWVAIVAGVVTGNTGFMTTSYIRLSEILHTEVDESAVTSAIDGVCDVLEQANDRFPATNAEKKRLKKVGRFAAFFLTEFLASPSAGIVSKWVDVIGRLRGTEQMRTEMTAALTTTGAQNLTAGKIAKVLENVNTYLNNGRVEHRIDLDDEEDDD